MAQTVAVKERPILFSGPMVKAILEGRKTQTRRIVKPQPDNMGIAGIKPWVITDSISSEQQYDDQGRMLFIEDNGQGMAQYWTNRYGEPGDQLWVRETWNNDWCAYSLYKADGGSAKEAGYSAEPRWRPSIHMPRALSRIQLEVTGVRLERLQDISEEDAIAEGCSAGTRKLAPIVFENYSARGAFKALWRDIYGSESLQANPFVWVISFNKIRPE